MNKNRASCLKVGIVLFVFFIGCILIGCSTPTIPTAPAATAVVGSTSTASPYASLEQIDNLIQNALKGNIAFNTPTEMLIDDIQTIQLLISPSLSGDELKQQIQSTQSGPVLSAHVNLSPRMKAELISGDPEAFTIQPLHDNPEQLISSKEPTEWKWLIHARKAGKQILTLTIYRLVVYDGKEYWREISYERTINIKVSAPGIIKNFDWKWLFGLLIPAVLVPLFWKWLDTRKKGKEKGDIKTVAHNVNRTKTGRNL